MPRVRLRGSSRVALSNQPLVYVDGIRIRSDGYSKNAPLNDQSRGTGDTGSPLDDIDPADIDRIEIVKGPAATTLYGTEAAAGVMQIFTRRGIPGRTTWRSELNAGVNKVRPYGTSEFPYFRLDPWLRSASQAGYSLSVGGGSDVRYYLSTSFHRDEGVLPNDLQKKLSVRGNFDFSPAKNLTVAINTAVVRNQLDNTPAGPNGQGLTFNAYRGPANNTGIDSKESLDRILAWKIASDINHEIGGATLVWTPGAASSHTLTLGYDRAESDMRSLRPYGFVFQPDGLLVSQDWKATTATVDYLGKWRHAIGRGVGGSIAWGAQSIGTDISSVAGQGEGFAGSSPPTLSSAATTLSTESITRAVIAGAFTQATLELRNRLFLTAGLRVDGSSSFGRDFGLQPYPRVSASYVVSDEDFWPKQLGTFRLRAAYGQAGRSPRVFDADRTWVQLGYNGQPAYVPSSVGNSLLGPERSTETELGFDASSRDDRHRAELTFYRKDTDDALLPVGQSPSNGFLNPQLENVGLIRYQGLELSLSTLVGSVDGFSVDGGVEIALNHSRVLSLNGTPSFLISGVQWIQQGAPAPVAIGLLIKNPNEIADPILEQNHVFGPNMPTRTIGAHADVHLWAGIRLGARVEYQGGNYLFDQASTSLYRSGVHPGCSKAYMEQTDGHPEQQTAWERIYCNTTTAPNDGSIERGDFMKLRDLSLTVPLRGSLLRSRSASVTLGARNFLIWKNSQFRFFDPEMGGRDGLDSSVRTIELTVPPPAGFTLVVRASY